MKKLKLRQLIEEVIKEETFNADYDKVFKILYNEGPEQYAVSLFIGKSLQAAEQEALKKLKEQYNYWQTEEHLWAQIMEPTQWKEIKRAKFKN